VFNLRQDAGGALKFRVASGANSDIGATAISLNNWYPFRIDWANNSTANWWVDYNNDGDFADAGEDEGTVTTIDVPVDWIKIGQLNFTETLTYELILLSVSETAMPTACTR